MGLAAKDMGDESDLGSSATGSGSAGASVELSKVPAKVSSGGSVSGMLTAAAVVPGSSIRAHFPIFKSKERAADPLPLPLSYLDSAASTQKPRVVIDRLAHFLSHQHANVHRGAYSLSAHATDLYDQARTVVADFLNASSSRSIVFTRGTTEAINLIAHSLEQQFQPGDVVLLTTLEHHSNIVPWQMLAARRGVAVLFAEIDQHACLDLAAYERLLAQHKPKLVSLTSVSNAFGTVLPLEAMLSSARAVGAITVVDAAQAVAHQPVDVQKLGCDFLAFSGHKLYGPTGIGALYVRENIFSLMQPFQGGGDMISSVTIDGSTWAEPPQKFEAGTPAIAEAIALGAAIEFIRSCGWSGIQAHEQKLFDYAWQQLSRAEGVTLYGPRRAGAQQTSILPFTVAGVHPHDLATIADSVNVQIRAGHHCAMPALKALGVQSTARASLGIYSCEADIDWLCEGIRRARALFA